VAETAGFARTLGVSALLLVIAALVALLLLPSRTRTVRTPPRDAAEFAAPAVTTRSG
jgi:hypothetical protein